jgi:hypothetical protein
MNTGHTGAAPHPDTIDFAASLSGVITLLGDGLSLNDATLSGTTSGRLLLPGHTRQHDLRPDH